MLAEELSYTVTASLWEYQGKGRWVFLTLPQDISAEIAFFAGGGKRRGWGAVPVQVRICATAWETSIFPDAATGCYLLPVKKAVRMAEGISPGDRVTLTLRVRP